MSREEDLAKQVSELREALQARDAFLAIAAHELRNPMHALLLQVGNTLNAARRSGDDDLVRRLERTRMIVDRYVKRATTLLDVSRMNAGALRLQIAELDLAVLVRQLVESYQDEASFNDVALRFTGPATLVGRWDELALEQIVSNLVTNAIRYGAGAPVDVILTRNDDATARLDVQDRGPGISPEDLARIFGRFEQAVTDQARGGFGVGLWLVRQLVEAHGGTVTVASVLDEGSTFAVQLPVDPSNPE